MRRPAGRTLVRAIAALVGAAVLPTYGILLLYSLAIDYSYAGRWAGADLVPFFRSGGISVYNASPKETSHLISAFERISYPLPERLSPVVVLADRLPPGVEGVFDTVTQRIYLRRHSDLGQTLAHEIGHLIENRLLTDEGRNQYEQLRGLPDWVEWGGAYRQSGDWERKASEDFAEVFAQLFSPDALFYDDVRTVFGQVDNPDELRDLYLSLLP